MKNLSDLKRFLNSNLYAIIIVKGDNDSIDKIVGGMMCFNGLNTTMSFCWKEQINCLFYSVQCWMYIKYEYNDIDLL